MLNSKQVTTRILLSIILGGIIGIDREKVGKPAGLRTHILVCLGSTITMLVSVFMFCQFQGKTNLDPGRIPAQVISGIGFLGAGTIMLEGPTVKGLTTAATLWVVAAIGLTIGIGFYYVAILATFFILLTLTTLRKFEDIILSKHSGKILMITLENTPVCLAKIGSLLETMSVNMSNVQINFCDNKTLKLTLKTQNDNIKDDIIKELIEIDGIKDIDYNQNNSINL